MTDFYSRAVMAVIAAALGAIAWNMTLPAAFISSAAAQIDRSDIKTLRSGLSDIASAIEDIRACSDK